jgi:hypothetical protein
LGRSTLKSVDVSPARIAQHDCVIILTDHSAYDIRAIVKAAKLVIDTRNSTKDLREFKDKIIKLGAGTNPPPSARRDDDHETAAQITAH